ncbi:hypothetical protein ACS126_11365 [Sphingobacterium lactis]|uniref:hypothetical protein n=1 Tax=Sphingobacterium lactis TaxID=797291 RepID=UPI003EC70E8B
MDYAAIKISYKQSGISEKNIKFIEQVRSELKDKYILNIRPNSGPQAGGLLDLTLEVILNLDLKAFITILRDGLIFDTVIRGKDSFILKPLFDTFSKIELSTRRWDYSCVSFIFDDTIVYIYGIENLFTSKIYFTLNKLQKIYNKLEIAQHGLPYQIVIPIEQQIDNKGNKVFLNDEHLKDYNLEYYENYWGLSYELGNIKKTLDLRKEIIIEEEWNLAWYIN